METRLFKKLPKEAQEIRTKVFVEEQGFAEEFDDIDAIALHLVVFDKGEPVAACRIYWAEEKGMYIVGRIAVLPQYRGMHIGADILSEAEAQVVKLGGRELYLHAQCRASAFYEKQGYRKMGTVELEQGCPHTWMFKKLA